MCAGGCVEAGSAGFHWLLITFFSSTLEEILFHEEKQKQCSVDGYFQMFYFLASVYCISFRQWASYCVLI